MDRRQIDSFFREFQKNFGGKITISLTGAAAGSLMGKIRPTLDIDFAVQIPNRSRKNKIWEEVEVAVQKTTARTGIAANFAEDIDRWSMIHFLDYKKRSKFYKRFGKVMVRILNPEYWAIGKFARYLDLDVQDLVTVLKHERVSSEVLANILGRALKKSPRSTALFQFRKQVEHFLKTYGTEVWGRAFPTEKTLSIFHRAAGIN